jgi:hypothetical protein
MRIILTILLASMLISCSSHTREKKEIEQKASTSQVKDSQALGGTINDLISNSKTLSDAQKKQLTDIIAANKKRADELSAESFKYRGVLIQELLSGKSSESRVRILEKDIERIENLRLKNTFDTVKKISAIVSKHPEHHEEITRQLMGVDGRGSSAR